MSLFARIIQLLMAQRVDLVGLMSAFFFLAVSSASFGFTGEVLDLSQAVVVVRPGELPSAEKAAATVLVEELEARTGIHLRSTSEWPKGKTVIAITSQEEVPAWGVEIPSYDKATEWDEGMSRERLSWQTTMKYPESMVYEGLDSKASYKVRMSGYGKFLLRIDGELVGAADSRVEMGEVLEVSVPAVHLPDRKLELTWDSPTDEGHLNWRKHSRLAEVWLIKQE